MTVDLLCRLLEEIEANQRAFIDTGHSWKRLIPLWRLRQQYRICKANEPLFAQLGIVREPFQFETGGFISAITRRLLGA